ncbi:hypothetical protein FNU76_23955 [Chitinimonas arctica]|uniref:Uncharacterized protein n=1 Tax=Chitinimonas arctica TaxID=2594795 RepID=A0A516SLZ8_9NEIS|nr:hypothetical protein [Chitinimonas arctica]QDQ24855.1 hypothetical protein FNU76_00025 [Chitinimonas arctica]QDQ27680.1 hypothetical protein FNU76_15720 [Chitinimonas arctica]QDQ29159.1 hypothetical protein FNU76_23955 [Chitinimonas arctica]
MPIETLFLSTFKGFVYALPHFLPVLSGPDLRLGLHGMGHDEPQRGENLPRHQSGGVGMKTTRSIAIITAENAKLMGCLAQSLENAIARGEVAPIDVERVYNASLALSAVSGQIRTVSAVLEGL